MWPFKRGGEIAVANNEEPDFDQQLIQQLATWRPIGETFEYLGRTMVVTAHHKIDVISSFHFPEIRMLAAIQADYADDIGVIHSITFGEQEAVALMLSQPTAPHPGSGGEKNQIEAREVLDKTVKAIMIFRNEPALERLHTLRSSAGYMALQQAMDAGRDYLEKTESARRLQMLNDFEAAENPGNHQK